MRLLLSLLDKKLQIQHQQCVAGSNPSSNNPAAWTARRRYVPSHLYHMVFELVKNSLRAVAERFDDSDMPPPPITVVVATGMEDVTIKVGSGLLLPVVMGDMEDVTIKVGPDLFLPVVMGGMHPW